MRVIKWDIEMMIDMPVAQREGIFRTLVCLAAALKQQIQKPAVLRGAEPLSCLLSARLSPGDKPVRT